MSSRFAASPSIMSFMAGTPDYGKLTSTAAMEKAKTEAMNLQAKAGIMGAGIAGENRKKIAKHQAKATVARGEAAGYSSMVRGLASGIGSVASGFESKGDPYFGQGTGEINTSSVNADIARIQQQEMVKRGFTPSTMYSGFPNQGLV